MGPHSVCSSNSLLVWLKQVHVFEQSLRGRRRQRAILLQVTGEMHLSLFLAADWLPTKTSSFVDPVFGRAAGDSNCVDASRRKGP